MTLSREQVRKLNDLFRKHDPVHDWRLYEAGFDLAKLEEAGIIDRHITYTAGPKFPELEPHD